jgi:phospholipase C
MSFYNQQDIPFYYALANQFAIGDKYFSSVMGPTIPNRFYLWAGSSFGVKKNPNIIKDSFHQKTIFDVFNDNKISWKYYYSDLPFLFYFRDVFFGKGGHIRPISEYYSDLAANKLPSIVFLESGLFGQTEEAPNNIQFGQFGVARMVNALLKSKAWNKSALFLTYDEGGGFFDHVSPPMACAPDAESAEFTQLGFRVPFVVVSPFVKRHFVSHVNYDHTSILKFIENKYNLPAMSRRDANANSLEDFFDYQNPNFAVPKMPEAKIDLKKLLKCLSPK